jgi:hypothetical protein
MEVCAGAAARPLHIWDRRLGQPGLIRTGLQAAPRTGANGRREGVAHHGGYKIAPLISDYATTGAPLACEMGGGGRESTRKEAGP